MAPSTGPARAAGGERKKKKLTREAKFKKAKAQEAAAAAASAGSLAKAKGKGKGKAKAKDEDEVEENIHPFRYKSFNDRLASVHINVSRNLGRGGTGALAGLDGHGALPGPSSGRMDVDGDEEDDDFEDEALHAKTAFGIAIQAWRELNLSLPFTSFAQDIQPLSLSLPLLLHNQERITSALSSALQVRYHDSYLAFEPALDLIPRLAQDLGSAFMPSYPELLQATLGATIINKNATEGEEHVAAKIVERAFESAAATLRCVAPHVLSDRGVPTEGKDALIATWDIVKPYLGGQDQSETFEDDESPEEVDEEAELRELEEDDPDALSKENGREQRQSAQKRKRPPPAHTRRFASEAFAHLVRKAKGRQLTKVAKIMSSDLQGALRRYQEEEDKKRRGKLSTSVANFACGIAGVWAEVVKSVDSRIHSAAPSHLSAALLSPVAGAEADRVAFKASNLIGRNVFTSLVHHSLSQHLVELHNFVIEMLDDKVKACQGDQESEEKILALVNASDWLVALTATRKGKRVDEQVKSKLFASLANTATVLADSKRVTDPYLREALERSLVRLLALALPLGRIQDLVGAGIKIVERLSTPDGKGLLPAAFVAMVLSLGDRDLDWSGYRQVALPTVLQRTSDAINSSNVAVSQQAFRVCALVQQQNQLHFLATATPTPALARWSNVVSTAVLERLSGLKSLFEENKGAEYGQDHVEALALAPLFKAQAEAMASLLSSLVVPLSAMCMASEGGDDPASMGRFTFLLGSCLDALAALLEQGSPSFAEKTWVALQPAQLPELVNSLAWHRAALLAYTRLCLAGANKFQQVNFVSLDDVAESLNGPLMGSDEALRLAASRLLALAGASSGAGSFLDGIVDIEQTALSVETIRERNVRTRALSRELLRLSASGEAKEKINLLVSIAVRYLVSTMRLNFMPLWEESRKALAELAPRFGGEVWKVAFDELKKPASIGRQVLQITPQESGEQSGEVGYAEDFEGEETAGKQFRDPLLKERRDAVDHFIRDARIAHSGSTTISLSQLADAQRPRGRLDFVNYQSQILKLFSSIHSVAERNNGPLMLHFFHTVASRAPLSEDDVEVERAEGETDEDNMVKLTVLERRTQLCAYLETFAHFSNPKALFRAKDLYSFLLTLCAQGDGKVQKMALDCILTWKDPAHTTYAAILKNFLEPSKFRDELTSLDLSPKGESIQKAHRHGFLALALHLLFGLMISRRGRLSSGSGASGRKMAILGALSECSAEELQTLVDLMLAPLQDQRPSFDDSGRFVFQRDGAPQASRKRQAGYLSLLGDVIKHLSLKLQPQWAQLIGVTLNLTYHASLAAESGQGKATLPDRAIRQTGLKRIADFFRQPTEYDWSAFLPALFEQLISPRLSLLKVESIQSPSAILDLIHTWSARSDTIFLLVEHEETLLDHVSACLAVPSVKPPVISKILDIIERALSFANDQVAEGQENVAEAVKDKVLRPHISPLIQSVAPLVQRCSGASGVEAKTMGREELLRRLLRLLADLAPLVSTADDASLLLELLGPMLRKSNALIPERSKTDLLQIFQDLLLLCPSFQDPSSETFSRHYDLFSSLFAILRSREARLQLGSVLRQFARIDGSLDRVTGWAEDLNAFSKRRIDEADFDRRLGAFDAINDERSPPNPSISAREWLPIVHNMIYFIQDADELAIRSNAGMTLRNFIDAVVATSYPVELKTIFSTVVYPGIRRALRSRHELVRREVLSVIGHAAEKLDRYEHLAEMRGLLAGGDDEANFFYNIHHLQIHRRARALRRLGDEAEKGSLKSKTISDVFAPLVGQFLFEENVEKSDHHLVNDAVVCLGRLTSQLQWGPYNAQLWKYLGLASKDKEHEKIFVRAAMAILDNFHFDMDEQALLDEAAADGDEDAEDGEERAEEEIDAGMQVDDEEQKTKAVAQSRKVLGAVTNRLLPKLMGYLNQKEDAEDTVRLPLAVGIVRVMQRLPVESRDLQIRKLLNTMANVFRSKSQETRDLAREALSRVALSLGPSYFAMLVHELRRALTRGPQLAVLAYTVHNILVNMMAVPYEDEKRDHLTLLDEGVADVVHVAAEDIFGHTAEDREANEHYRSKTREMRQSKSVDTFEQLAKVVAPKQMTTVLAPVRDIMQQTEAQRAVRGIDGVLKRIAAGLNANAHFADNDFLVLIHTLLNRDSPFLQPRKKEKVDGDKDLPPNHTVLLKRRDVEKGQTNRDHFSRNVHRFVAFGLDMLITALRRNRFDVADAGTRSRLEPMVSSVANCLYAPEVDLVTLALKAVGSLVKLGSETLPSLQKGLPLIVKQTIKLVQSEGGTQSDVSQAALKMLSVVMREDEVDFSEQHLADLCHLIVSDLEEPAVQSTLFALLKSIVGRRFVVAQVYDAMDKVAEMLVTNQTSSVRETCRSLFLQFLLDYPQGKKRLSNQMHFLAKNVSYTYESGRLSVMELIRVVLAKFDATLLKDYLDVFFVALVMVLANDDSAPCRDEAAKLITTIVTLSESSDGELGENGIGKLVRLTHAWAEQSDKPALARVAVQTYGLLLDGAPAFASAWVPRATKNASKLLGQCVEQLEEVERKGTPAESMGQDIVAQLDLDWQLPYQTMQTLSKLYKREDCRSLLDDANIWADVRGLLLFPHSWVRIAACRLLASLFAHADQEVVVDRLRGSGEDEALGLVSLVDAARKMALQLKSPQLEEDLGLQIVKNLVFLGRCFAPISKSIVSKDQEVFVDETDAVVDDGDHEDSEEESVDEGPDKPEAEEERETEQGWRENPLAWLFSKLSYQARTARLHGELNNSVSGAGSVRGTKAILQWMAAMSQHLSTKGNEEETGGKKKLETFLPHIIHVLFRLVSDPVIASQPSTSALSDLAKEVQELVQGLVGTSAFASVWTRVQAQVRQRRERRKQQVLTRAIRDPEAQERRKRKINENKHKNRKRKNQVHASRKEGVRPVKRHRM